VLGRELVTASLVVTSFTDPIAAVAIVIDDQFGVDAAGALSMRLADATRVPDAAGAVLPPQVLVDGTRSILVYAVTTTGPSPRVFVDNPSNGELAGVFGSPAGVADLAAVLAASGAAAAAQQPLVGGPGLRQVSVVLGDGPVVTGRANKRAPAKNVTTRKAAPRRGSTR